MEDVIIYYSFKCSLVIMHSLLQTLSNVFGEISWVLVSNSAALLALGMIDVSQIVKGSTLAQLKLLFIIEHLILCCYN